MWTTADVHQALLRWGATTARMAGRGLGYPSQVPWSRERIGVSYQALSPSDFTTEEFQRIESAIGLLPQTHRVVLLSYYKPGHLRSQVDLGTDGKGRQRSPSIRAIASVMLISKDAVMLRLSQSRTLIAEALTALTN